MRTMLKIMSVVITSAVIFMASPTVAQADGQICITNYGGAVECPQTPPSPTVNAGLEDINPVVLGSILMGLSGLSYSIASIKAKSRAFSSR